MRGREWGFLCGSVSLPPVIREALDDRRKWVETRKLDRRRLRETEEMYDWRDVAEYSPRLLSARSCLRSRFGSDRHQSREVCNFRRAIRLVFRVLPPRSSYGFFNPPWLLSTITTSLETTLAQTLTLTTRTMTNSNSILMLVPLNPKLKLHGPLKVSMMRTSRWLTHPDPELLWKSTVRSSFCHPPGLIILLESKELVSRRASGVLFNPGCPPSC